MANVESSQNSCIDYSSKNMMPISHARLNKSFILSSDEQIINQIEQTAIGNASLYGKGFQLIANKITLNKKTKALTAQNNIHFTDAKLYFNSEQLSLSNIEQQPILKLASASFKALNTQLFGQAGSLTASKDKYIFSKTNWTTCSPQRKIWQIESKQLTLDFASNKGIAEQSIFRLMGVSLFYLPRYEWKLSGRKSGFLVPEFSTYQSSNKQSQYQVNLPYYFNIAPDKELTFVINYFSDRGYGLEGHYRQLLSQSDVDIKTNYLVNDRLLDKPRWLFNSQNNLAISPYLDLLLAINRVSDVDFFGDIEHQSFNEKTLNSLIQLRYQKDNTKIILNRDSQQLIQGSPSYVRQPELLVRHDKKIIVGELNSLLGVVDFRHQDANKISGVRLHTTLNYHHEVNYDAYTIKPAVNLFYTHYNIAQSKKLGRGLVNINLNADWHLLRNINWFGNKAIQTLTPSVFYNYTQNKNQDELPNFDSEIISQSYAALFNHRFYTGFDRIQAANNITLGLASGIYKEKTGKQFLQAGIAQTFFTKKSNNPFNAEQKQSNIIMYGRINQDKKQFFDVRLQYNTGNNKIAEQHYVWHYKQRQKTFLTLAYHAQEDDNNAFFRRYGEINGSYLIGGQGNLFTQFQYDLSNNLINKNAYGIEYEDCCTIFRLAKVKSYNSSNNYNSVFELKFEYKISQF